MLNVLSGFRQFLRMSRKNCTGFYAIHSGRRTGVVNSWEECEGLVKGFKGAKFKKFSTFAEAQNFARDGSVAGSNGKSVAGENSAHDSTSQTSTQPPATSKSSSSDGSQQPSLGRKRQLEDETVVPVVYTDGACSGNGKSNAKAGIGVYWGDGDPRNVSEPLEGKPTNNRAEILAAARAIQQAKDQGFKKVEIRTDSAFLIESATKWIPGWQAKEWMTSAGKPVINKDDFQDLLVAKEGIKVIWTHVAGHAGIHGNEQADTLAVSGMRKRRKL